MRQLLLNVLSGLIGFTVTVSLAVLTMAGTLVVIVLRAILGAKIK